MGNMRIASPLRFSIASGLFLILLLISTAHAQLSEVTTLIQQGRYPEAVDKLERLAASVKEKDVETRSWCYYQLGEIYYNYTQQYPEALKAYKKIIGMQADTLSDAEIFLAYIKTGDVYSRMGKYEQAIQTYQTLVDVAPESHFAYKIGLQKIRGIQTALENLQVQERIIDTYKGTPLAAVAQFQIAELYRTPSQLNQPERAIAAYQVLLKTHPTAKLAPEAQWRIAHLRHTALNQLSLAIVEYQKVADDFPTSNFAAEALFQIANLHRKAAAYTEALTVFEALAAKYPNFWNMHAVFYWSGICHEHNQNYGEALIAFKTFLHVHLPHLDPAYLGQIGMYDKNVSEVTALLREKIDTLTQQLPRVEWEKLEKAIAKTDYITALTIIRYLIANAPNTVYAKRAAAQHHAIRHRAAIQTLQTQIQKETPNSAERVRAQLQIGTIYERELQDYPKAVDAYKALVKAHPESAYAAEALYRTGIIYAEKLDTPNTALQTYKAVIAQHPNSLHAMMANFQLGEIYRKLQRYNEALQAYRTTLGYPERELYLPGGHKDSFADRAQFRIGRVHYEDQRYTEARFAFEEFIQNRKGSPRFAAAHIYLAVMHQEAGEKDSAKTYYRKAQKLLNDNPIQLQTVIDEAGTLGLHSTDTVTQFLQERLKRLETE